MSNRELIMLLLNRDMTQVMIEAKTDDECDVSYDEVYHVYGYKGKIYISGAGVFGK